MADETPEAPSADAGAPPMSKNAQKRLAKMEHRAATRAEWKARMREKDAAKRARLKASSAAQLSVHAAEGAASPPEGVVSANSKDIAAADAPPLAIVIDAGYESLMNEREITSLAVQVCRAYSAVRRARVSARLVVYGVDGALRSALDKMYPDHGRWLCDMHSEPLSAAALSTGAVYLSADSASTLHDLGSVPCVVIGGLVDKNRHKGAAHARAALLGVPTARLPLADHAQLRSSPVLTVVHVVEMLCRVRDGAPWPDAIFATIPSRKNRD